MRRPTYKQGIVATLDEVKTCTDPETIVKSYNCYGGTGVKSVENMIENIRKENDELKDIVEADKKRLNNAYEKCLAFSDAVRNNANEADFNMYFDKYLK